MKWSCASHRESELILTAYRITYWAASVCTSWEEKCDRVEVPLVIVHSRSHPICKQAITALIDSRLENSNKNIT